MRFQQGVALGGFQVLAHHLGTHLLHGDLWHPAQLLLGLGRIAQQRLNFGRTEIARIDSHHHVARIHRRSVVTINRIDGTPVGEPGQELTIIAHYVVTGSVAGGGGLPEPGTGLLFAVGLLLLAARGRSLV